MDDRGSPEPARPNMHTAEEAYVSPKPWDSARPSALAVCCSDGRYHHHFEEFLRGRVGGKTDLIALPGGAASVDPWASSFDRARVFEESIELLLSTHELDSIWLISHEGCAFYRKKHGAIAAEDLRERQHRDLRRARERILERWPRIEVRLVHAAVEKERVRFLEVDPG